jgi:hypothetical protein
MWGINELPVWNYGESGIKEWSEEGIVIGEVGWGLISLEIWN